MSETSYPGIDYGMGTTNVSSEGIRYGVLPFHDICQAWCDSSEANYGKPELTDCDCPRCGHNEGQSYEWGDNLICEECDESYEIEFPDCAEPISHVLDDGEYLAEQSGDSCDIFILKSPYYTHAQFCSPCAPGAGYLRNPCEAGPKTYCFSHDWFDDESPCPYPVYQVSDNVCIYTPEPTE
jgi:hypothetical protein